MILDLWLDIKANVLSNNEQVEIAFTQAAEIAGATVLNQQWHHFGEGYGLTGVVMLAESHMSIHTWPEYGYAAIDVFMCGECDPKKTLSTMMSLFKPKSYSINELTRGLLIC